MQPDAPGAPKFPWDCRNSEERADTLASFLLAPMLEEGAKWDGAFIEQVPWFLELATTLKHTAGSEMARMIGESLEQELEDICQGWELCRKCGRQLDNEDRCPMCDGVLPWLA